ncbi:MAG TPA: lysophospholipid acyltransferase family protein [Candidatus Paceibacterota bacterium]
MLPLITELAQFILSIPTRLLLIICADFKAEGLEILDNIDTSKGIILASNHVSQLDSIAIGCALPPLSKFAPIYYVALAKKEYFRFPIGKYIYGGAIFRLLGAYAIQRGVKDYALALANHIPLLKQGKTISIFPEGRVQHGGKLGEARGGMTYMSHVSGAPIVPTAIIGLDDVRWWEFLMCKRKVIIRFGNPIYFSEIDEPSLPPEIRYHKAAQKVMLKVGELIHT